MFLYHQPETAAKDFTEIAGGVVLIKLRGLMGLQWGLMEYNKN